MIKSKIAEMCQERGTIVIMERGAARFVGTLAAIYKIDAARSLDSEGIVKLLGFTKKQMKRIDIFKMEDEQGTARFPTPKRPSRKLGAINFGMSVNGFEIWQTDRGVDFINPNLLGPLDNEKDDINLISCGRPHERYFAAMRGNELRAIVLPADFFEKWFINRVKRLLELCEIGYIAKIKSRDAANAREALKNGE